MARKMIEKTTKKKVMEEYSNGVSRKKIAEKYGISLSSVARIIQQKSSQQGQEKTIKTEVATERQKRIEALEIRIAELEKKILEAEAKKKS